MFYFNVLESQIITTLKQIFQFYFQVVYLLALVIKRATYVIYNN